MVPRNVETAPTIDDDWSQPVSLQETKGGALYIRVGVVKRHFQRARGTPAAFEPFRLWSRNPPGSFFVTESSLPSIKRRGIYDHIGCGVLSRVKGRFRDLKPQNRHALRGPQ